MKKIIFAAAALCFIAAGAGAVNYVQYNYAAKIQLANLQREGQYAKPKPGQPKGGSTHIYSRDEIIKINDMIAQNEKTFAYVSGEISSVTESMASPADNAALQKYQDRLDALNPMLTVYNYNFKPANKEYYFQKFPVKGPDYNEQVQGAIFFLRSQMSSLYKQINQQLQSSAAAAQSDSIPPAQNDTVPPARPQQNSGN